MEKYLPNIFVLEALGENRIFFAFEPELTVRDDCRLDPVDHSQDPHGRAQSIVRPFIQVGSVKLKGTVGAA